MYFVFSLSFSDFCYKAIPRTYQSPLVYTVSLVLVIKSRSLNLYAVGVRGIIGIPINRDAVWKRYVSRYGLVVSVHSGIFVSFRKSK